MDRHWLLTWTTYGTWLPGDERGFVGQWKTPEGKSTLHNIPGTDYDQDHKPLQLAMQESLRCPPIYLNLRQATQLLEQFQETTAHRGWENLAIAIMASHVHMVVGVPGDPDPEKLLQAFKSYGSRKLNKSWLRPASDTWWTESGSKRKLPNERAILGAARYVRDQERPLVVWVHPRIAPLLRTKSRG